MVSDRASAIGQPNARHMRVRLDVIAPYVIAEILPKKLPLSISTIQRIKKEVAQRLQEYLPTERHRRHWRLATLKALELEPFSDQK